MKKPTLDQLGKIKTISYIPTIEEEYRDQSILIEFEDGSLVDYTFEIGEEVNYSSIKKINKHMLDCYEKSKKLTNIIKKIYPNIKQVYIADL